MQKNIQRKFTFAEEIQFGYHDEVKPYGTNTELSGEKCTVARRKETDQSENGIIYGGLPLRGTAEFEIKLTNVKPDKGSMSIGVIRVKKGLALFKHKIVRKSRGFVGSCIWNTGKIYNALGLSDSELKVHSYGYKDLGGLRKGDHVGLQLSSYDGSLSFFINGHHQGFAAKGVYDDTKSDIYVVVEHTGGCCGTEITRAGKLLYILLSMVPWTHALHSLVPRLLPVFQCCTLKRKRG